MTEVLFLLNNTFKVAFKYLVNVFILLNIVFNLRLNIKVKIYPKMRTFKNLEKIKKKTSGNSVLCVFYTTTQYI